MTAGMIQPTSGEGFVYFGLYLGIFLEVLVGSVKYEVAVTTGCY